MVLLFSKSLKYLKYNSAVFDVLRGTSLLKRSVDQEEEEIKIKTENQ